MSTDQQYIQHLLDRFMSGQSTLAEEQQLSRYMATHEVESEWKAYQEIFAYFDAGMTSAGERGTAPSRKRLNPSWLRWVAAAAIAALVATAGLMMWNSQPVAPRQAARYAVASEQRSAPLAHHPGTQVSPPEPDTCPATPTDKERLLAAAPKQVKRRVSTPQPVSASPKRLQISRDDAEMELALMRDVALEVELEEQQECDELEWALLQASTMPQLLNVDDNLMIK